MKVTTQTSRRSPATLRVIRAEVDGERLILHCEVVGEPVVEGSRLELVLRERSSGTELRVGLVRDGDAAVVAGGIDAAALWTGAGAATWEVRAELSRSGDGVETCAVVSVLDPVLAPSVVLRRNDDLHRVRLRSSGAGEVTVAVEPLPPHAEVQRVRVEDDAVVVEVVPDRRAPTSGRSAAVVAVSRARKVEVTEPADVEGSTVRARIPLSALAADVADTEYWDLSLRIDGFPPLRLGGHLDDVVDKKHAVVYPARDVPSPAGGRSLRPYFTVHNNLSIRSKPVQEGSATTPARAPSPDQPDGDSAWRAVQRVGIHIARAAAMLVARTVIRRLPSRRPLPPMRDGRPHVAILIVHGYGMGGTVRTVFNQAAHLSRDHDVEIVSQFRERKEPFFQLPPGVALTPLDDRTDEWNPARPLQMLGSTLSKLPSLLVHEADVSFERCSLWTDVQVVRRLRAQRGGILMATRPSLNLLVAQLAAPGVVTVGQEHMNFQQHRQVLATALHREYRRLDALTVLTRGDLEDYTKELAGSGTRVVRIPNSVSPLTGGPADPSSKVVVAAGRLTRQKGFDLLIPAFEQVVREHPDWTLRIYGSGPHRQRLRRMILERGLYNNILLMGRAQRMGDELAKGSIYVLSSRFEGFAMVIIEAMSKGLAVVSFDCPRGPGDLITHGEDGLLVPNGDVNALARGLLQVVEDESERRRLGAAAVHAVGRYDPEVIGRQWDDFLQSLLDERRPSWWQAGSRS